MRWDPAMKSWTLINGIERRFSRQSSPIEPTGPARLAGRAGDKDSSNSADMIRAGSLSASGNEYERHFSSLQMGALNFLPEDIRKKQEKPEEMDYDDLRQFIANQQHAGHDVSRWLVDLYNKISFPFASAIVVLFGIPFSSIKRRSGPGVEFAIALAVCFLYMVFLQVSQAFGYNGDLHPLLTAWAANGVFLIAGMYILWRVPK
jgi:lipopolysaccharide export LptBFGC system permease protein LptF